MTRHTLGKRERIKSRKLIRQIFREGNKVYRYPLVLFWLPVPFEEAPLLFGVSVSKKKVRRAVDRNLAKRRIRESFRLHKARLVSNMPDRQTSAALFFVYIADKVETYNVIDRSMEWIHLKLEKRWRERSKL